MKLPETRWLLLGIAIFVAVGIAALAMRGPRPALTILHHGKPAAHVVVSDPLSDDHWTTDDDGTIWCGAWEKLPNLLNIPTPDGEGTVMYLTSEGYRTIDMHQRFTKTTLVGREFGFLKTTSTSMQVHFTDEEEAAIERGEATREEMFRKVWEEVGGRGLVP